MRAEVSIEFDYLEGRRNPAEVFEAMAMYINAYRDFGQLISTVAGMEADFYFQLNSIEKGSIISKLSAASNKASFGNPPIFNGAQK